MIMKKKINDLEANDYNIPINPSGTDRYDSVDELQAREEGFQDYLALRKFISGCILTIKMEFFCIHIFKGRIMSLVASVNRIMASP